MGTYQWIISLFFVVENKNDEKFRMQEEINNTRKVCKMYVCDAMNYRKLFIKFIKKQQQIREHVHVCNKLKL